jgi:hypothetical protein
VSSKDKEFDVKVSMIGFVISILIGFVLSR